jgi:hypothetical protein
MTIFLQIIMEKGREVIKEDEVEDGKNYQYPESADIQRTSVENCQVFVKDEEVKNEHDDFLSGNSDESNLDSCEVFVREKIEEVKVEPDLLPKNPVASSVDSCQVFIAEEVQESFVSAPQRGLMFSKEDPLGR